MRDEMINFKKSDLKKVRLFFNIGDFFVALLNKKCTGFLF